MSVLIVSSSKGNNYKLAKSIGSLLTIDYKIISLEDFKLPLFYPGGEDADDYIINDLVSEFKNVKGFIFCAPEYNYNIPPILNNAITWISVKTDYWRDAFFEKKVLIATHSGGPAFCFLSSFRSQLEHLGAIVHPRTIAVHRKAEFNSKSIKKILISFQNLIEL